jgi:hypothetical protein
MDRRPTDPIVLALAAAIAEITARRAAEAADRRRRIVVVSGGKEGRAA